MSDWNVRRIFKELLDTDERRAILADFWRHGDAATRLTAQDFLARTLHFRDASIRKLTPERKAELLASRIGNPESGTFLGSALMQHHLQHRAEMMAAFLDRWGIANSNGQIEDDDVPPPDTARVRAAVEEVGASFDRRAVRLYLASAGLLMGDDWAAAMWPVVDEMA